MSPLDQRSRPTSLAKCRHRKLMPTTNVHAPNNKIEITRKKLVPGLNGHDGASPRHVECDRFSGATAETLYS